MSREYSRKSPVQPPRDLSVPTDEQLERWCDLEEAAEAMAGKKEAQEVKRKAGQTQSTAIETSAPAEPEQPETTDRDRVQPNEFLGIPEGGMTRKDFLARLAGQTQSTPIKPAQPPAEKHAA